MELKTMSTALPLSICLLIVLFSGQAYSARFVSPASFSAPSFDLVSDGVQDLRNPLYLRLNPFSSVSASSCDQTYGFMPCTSSWIGSLFLIVAYGYLMFLSAKSLSTGSELLLEIMGPGIVGGLFLPMLGALPDALLILVSGLSGSKTTAQSQVTVGMGLLAGSTVMLLTLIWGSCVIVGKCDIQDSVALDGQNTKGFNLIESGVSTDIWTSYAGRIMVISIIPFLVVQIPQAFSSTSGKHLAVLIALIVALSLLVAYLIYQLLQPVILRRRREYYNHRHVIYGVLTHLRKESMGRLLNDQGQPDKETIKKIFGAIDQNTDGYLSASELRALMVGIQFKEIDFNQNDAIDKVMKDFDTSHDYKIDSDEFVEGIAKWLSQAQHIKTPRPDGSGSHTLKFLHNFHQETKREHDLLDVGDQSDDVIEGVDNAKMIVFKAVLYLLLGTIVAAVFADPLVDAVDAFSDATSIPAFFISFIVLPFATNSSESVSAIIFASRKKRRTASLTFSELYGAATMNNLLCLSVFLALVYIRGLSWDFSAEVLVILIVCILMGVFSSFRTTFPLWTSLVAFSLYPFSLVLVYILDYIVGWS